MQRSSHFSPFLPFILGLCFFFCFPYLKRESVKSGGHHCCPCQAPAPPPVLVTTSPSTRIIRQSSQPEASACCCSGCCCPLHSGAAPSAASLRQLREPGDGIAGIAADSLRINGGIRQFRQVNEHALFQHFHFVNKQIQLSLRSFLPQNIKTFPHPLTFILLELSPLGGHTN